MRGRPTTPGLQELAIPDALCGLLAGLIEPGGPGRDLRLDDPPTLEALRASLHRHRCWALAATAVAVTGTPVGPDLAQELREAATRELAGATTLDRVLVALVDRFEEAGIPLAATKGAAFARVLWPGDAGRAYSDVDVVTPRPHLAAAAAVVESLGGHLQGGDPRDPVVQRWGKSVTYRVTGNVEVDLHVTPCSGPYAHRLREAELFDDLEHLAMGGRQVPTLSREHLFLHACYHAVLPADDRRLVPLVDVAMGLANPHLDPDRLLELAGRHGASAVVAVAVNAACDLFALAGRETAARGTVTQGTVARWAAQYRLPRRDRRWLDSYDPDRGAQLLRMTGHTLEALPSWADRRAYAAVLVRGSGTGGLRRVSRVVRRVRGGPGPARRRRGAVS